VFSPFFISDILGAKDGWNVLMLRVVRNSDFTGITFRVSPSFRELAWIGVGLLCLALSGRRSLATQEGRTRESGNDF
jgi:hypothetical protein